MARALILIADGFADEEVLPLRDALTEAGNEAILVGPVQGGTVKGAKGTELVAQRDPLHLDLNHAHLVVAPSGGADALAGTPSMVNIVYSVAHKGRLVATAGRGIQLLLAAAAQKPPNPAATGTRILEHGILEGRRVAVDESFREAIEKAGARVVPHRPVVADPPLITARRLDGATLARFLDEVLPLLPAAGLPVVGRIL